MLVFRKEVERKKQSYYFYWFSSFCQLVAFINVVRNEHLAYECTGHISLHYKANIH